MKLNWHEITAVFIIDMNTAVILIAVGNAAVA